MNHHNIIQNFLENLTRESAYIEQDPHYEPEYLSNARRMLACSLGADDLPQLVKEAQQDLVDRFRELEQENPDYILNDYAEFADSVIFEIAEGFCPVYTWTLNTLHYLYKEELEEVLEDAGIDTDDNKIGMAIILYIEQSLNNNFDEILSKAFRT